MMGSVLLLLGALSAITALAKELTPGDAAPTFQDIVGIDDKKHGLADYEDAKAVVVVFTCNHCPVAQAYEGRLVALQDQYKEQGVQLLAINVNNLPADRLEAMKKRAEEKGFNFPYLYDSSQKTGHAYGATVTPHVFLLDKDRKVAYQGAIDDNMDPDKVTAHYLADAIDALLVGKKPTKATTKAFGCGIKYE
jgi:peroxiredoxin